MGPPPRSLAAEANGCFMVRVRRGPNRIQGSGARDAPDSGLPSDQSKHASTIGEQSDAIKLDTDIPIQGCVKTLVGLESRWIESGFLMKRFVEGEDRTQVLLLPEFLDDYVTEDNPVRVVDV